MRCARVLSHRSGATSSPLGLSNATSASSSKMIGGKGIGFFGLRKLKDKSPSSASGQPIAAGTFQFPCVLGFHAAKTFHAGLAEKLLCLRTQPENGGDRM